MVARTIVAFAVVLCLACGGSATVMQHYLTYSAKGTRSEARHGHLVVGKRELPWAFSRVGRGDVSYSLRFRSQLWGEDGYFPDTTPVIPPSSDVRVSQASLSRGYYIGDHWLKGTPADWLFVHWAADRSAFVAPDAIDALVNDFHIPIHGEGEPPRLRPMTGS